MTTTTIETTNASISSRDFVESYLGPAKTLTEHGIQLTLAALDELKLVEVWLDWESMEVCFRFSDGQEISRESGKSKYECGCWKGQTWCEHKAVAHHHEFHTAKVYR